MHQLPDWCLKQQASTQSVLSELNNSTFLFLAAAHFKHCQFWTYLIRIEERGQSAVRREKNLQLQIWIQLIVNSWREKTTYTSAIDDGMFSSTHFRSSSWKKQLNVSRLRQNWRLSYDRETKVKRGCLWSEHKLIHPPLCWLWPNHWSHFSCRASSSPLETEEHKTEMRFFTGCWNSNHLNV